MKKRFVQLFLGICMLLLLKPVSIYADVAQEQESIAESKADEAYENLNNKGDSAMDKYGQLMEDVQNGELSSPYKTFSLKGIVTSLYKGYQTYKYAAPYIVLASIIIGLLVVLVARYNKKARQFAVVFLIIGVPVFVIASVFVIGWLNGKVL